MSESQRRADLVAAGKLLRSLPGRHQDLHESLVADAIAEAREHGRRDSDTWRAAMREAARMVRAESSVGAYSGDAKAIRQRNLLAPGLLRAAEMFDALAAPDGERCDVHGTPLRTELTKFCQECTDDKPPPWVERIYGPGNEPEPPATPSADVAGERPDLPNAFDDATRELEQAAQELCCGTGSAVDARKRMNRARAAVRELAGISEPEPPRLTPEIIEEALKRGARNAADLEKQLDSVFTLRPESAGLMLRGSASATPPEQPRSAALTGDDGIIAGPEGDATWAQGWESGFKSGRASAAEDAPLGDARRLLAELAHALDVCELAYMAADDDAERERLQRARDAARAYLTSTPEAPPRTAAEERADVVAWLDGMAAEWRDHGEPEGLVVGGVALRIKRGQHEGAAARAKGGG